MDQNKETEIKNKIYQLIKNVKCENIFPVPVEKIVKYLQYKLFKFVPNEKTKDISGAVSHKQKAIYINNSDNIRRQFFTIAHEIGHIVLHGRNENFIDYRRDLDIGSNAKEFETNEFAAQLLMPAKIFQEKWLECEQDDSTKITYLSNYFGVSDLATRVRAHRLDLLN
jgi:Zn-dependent peptidase ImmA (M78 family)